MFSHFPDSYLFWSGIKHHMIMPDNHLVFFFVCHRPDGMPFLQFTDLSEYPRIPQGSPSDHHSVCICLLLFIQRIFCRKQITVSDHLALIATVGRGMVRNFGTAARLFTAISSQGISIRTIDQGSSELNIIVGVDEEDFEAAVKAIYDTFVRT